MCFMIYILVLVLNYWFLAFSQGPGGFRELWESYRNHFHRSWYLSDAGITSYSQKPSWGESFLPSTVGFEYMGSLMIWDFQYMVFL